MIKKNTTIWTTSRGIMASQHIASLLDGELKKVNLLTNIVNKADVVLGWGNKKNTLPAKKFAQQNKLTYICAEDGFIGYIGHPARKGYALSLITDTLGIYYDARQPSQLEQLISQPSDEKLLKRADQLIEKITTFGITKYNCYTEHTLPKTLTHWFTDNLQPCILLVDQVAGDLSIEGALASETDFIAMVDCARKNHPKARLLLRTHPDTRLGKKSGVLAKLNLPDLTIISEACHPHVLIKQVEAVYTVSSQMGFEALLLNKPVYCFGLPFYAGWGLTTDTKNCIRRNTASLAELVAAALIRYPSYFDPILAQPCEVEEVIDLIALQYCPAPKWQRLYLLGFSLWKRAFMKGFCQHLADEIKFVSAIPKQLTQQDKLLVWGNKYSQLTDCIRVEDGFIRSTGLGSNLYPPSSLSLDQQGIYFNSAKPSALETLFMEYTLNEDEIKRGNKLIKTLKATGVSKYNTGKDAVFSPAKTTAPLLLVIGQVDGDASITTGSAQIKSNEALLWAVRDSRPDAYIIYKPHPDVVSGNRAGSISTKCLAHCIDEQVLNLGLTSLYPHIDELHTMTSLSGFEALVQGVKVVTWGQPFYAGWGLTLDMNPLKRRTKKLTLASLVYLTLARYPSYIDWKTGLWSSPEKLIATLSQQKKAEISATNFWQRTTIKMKVLFQIIINK